MFKRYLAFSLIAGLLVAVLAVITVPAMSASQHNGMRGMHQMNTDVMHHGMDADCKMGNMPASCGETEPSTSCSPAGMQEACGMKRATGCGMMNGMTHSGMGMHGSMPESHCCPTENHTNTEDNGS